MKMRCIPVAAPVLGGNEKLYVNDCLDTTWISSTGKYIGLFESGFAEYCGVKHASTCSNGTVALHLALLALGVGSGDEVIVPALTFVASANAVVYCNATPVFVDSEPETWNIDPALIEAAVTSRTRGIVVVHLYGHPADMDAIREIAERHRLFIVEDAAEAHGALYKGQRVGSLGDVSTFSFYGNKVITTGEGGMVATNDDAIASRMRQLKGQGMDPDRRYWFPVVGYNYRMTNVAAAIGLAQLERINWHLERRREVAEQYMELLKGVPGLRWQGEAAWAHNVYWMFTILIDEESPIGRDDLMQQLADRGIETRPIFYPMHMLPPYSHLAPTDGFPVAESVARRGLNLPSWAGLSREDVAYVCASLIECLKIK